MLYLPTERRERFLGAARRVRRVASTTETYMLRDISGERTTVGAIDPGITPSTSQMQSLDIEAQQDGPPPQQQPPPQRPPQQQRPQQQQQRPDGDVATAVNGAKLKHWLVQYAAKARGGPAHMPERVCSPSDAAITWGGTFVAIGLLEAIFSTMNDTIQWAGQEDLFILSGSFGALATLVYAVADGPLSQPRVVVSAHTLAMAVSMAAIRLFERGKMVWLQKAVTVSTTVVGMSLIGVVHPPAGALCLVFLGVHNNGATDERMLALILSMAMGIVVHLVVAVVINNVSPRRRYPVFW